MSKRLGQTSAFDKENQSVLTSFDYTAIDEMDPSLGKNHSLMLSGWVQAHIQQRSAVRVENH